MTSHGTTIELAGIGAGMDDRMLMNMYRTYGPIVRVTHNGSNSAQVVFAQENHANQAVEATNGAVVYGKTLKVRLQRPFAKVNKPCRGFAAGICRQGEMCKYQHVTDTAQHAPKTPSTVQKVKREKKKAPKTASEPAVVPPEIQAIPGKRVCRHFSRGYCSQGAECAFAHILGLPKPAEEASTEKTNRPCLFFQSGVCTRGDACRFAHEPKPSATPVAAVVKKTKATKKTAAPSRSSDHESETEPGQNNESRTCVECEKPGVAVWKCAKCDNSLYCNDCNSAVHRARVMAKHKRAKLPPVPKLPRCGECESKAASVQCEQCEVAFCSSCDASVHNFKSLRKHSRVKLSLKSEKAKPQIEEEPKAAKKTQVKKKRTEEPASLPKVADHVAYVESVPKLTFSESESSDSEDEDMAEASPVQSSSSTRDDDEPMPAAAGSSDTETDDDFDDVKPRSSGSASITPTPVIKEEASESESEEDFDDKPTPASVPKTELSSDSESSDDEAPEATPVSKSTPKTELSSDSESEDDSQNEASPASKPAPAPVVKPSLAELSSESDDDSDDEVPFKPAVRSTPKPASKPAAKVSSNTSDDCDDEAASKPALKKTPSKSSTSESSSDSSSSDSSDSEDETPSAKPTPAPRRAPARNNKAGGISEGSSHTLVKKIEAFSESGEGNELHLDANLNGFERLLAHDCAERLGLAHESVGAGLERHIIISRHGSKRPPADSSSGHKAKKSKHHH